MNVVRVAGKSFENVRNRRNFHLVCSAKTATKLVSKPTFKKFDIINEGLTLIEMAKTSVMLNKPIYVGFAVLEASKLLMYQFHYQKMTKMFPKPDQLSLLFTDTGKCVCYIKSSYHNHSSATKKEVTCRPPPCVSFNFYH